MLRPILLLAGVAAAFPAAAQQREAQPAEDERAIIVTGQRIQDYRARLAACLARGCPVNEDVDASLALAEALFLTGDYEEARRAVRASLERNRRRARDYPEPVSDLYRADARVSRHLARDRAALRSTHGILEALQEGLPQEDHRHFTARFEIAQAQMLAGEERLAIRTLERLAEIARRSGREDVAALAELRAIWFQMIAEPRGTARGRLVALSRSTDPAQRMQATGAKVLLARIYREEGNEREADALLASLRARSQVRRVLLHAPEYQLRVQEAGQRGTMRSSPDDFENAWIDVGFWVLPDGRVSELEILRRGADASWAGPLLESVRDRIYTSASEASYRMERYTYTSPYEDPSHSTGTRLPRRSLRTRVEYLDLTEDPAPAQAPSSSTSQGEE